MSDELDNRGLYAAYVPVPIDVDKSAYHHLSQFEIAVFSTVPLVTTPISWGASDPVPSPTTPRVTC